MKALLQKLRRKWWPVRDELNDDDLYTLAAPATVAGVPIYPIQFVCRHGSFPNPCKDCQGTFTNAV